MKTINRPIFFQFQTKNIVTSGFMGHNVQTI